METFVSIEVNQVSNIFSTKDICGIQISGSNLVIRYSNVLLTMTVTDGVDDFMLSVKAAVEDANSGGVFAPDKVFEAAPPNGETVTSAVFSLA